jgi:predicted NBD/HSP70 family sugar kinase
VEKRQSFRLEKTMPIKFDLPVRPADSKAGGPDAPGRSKTFEALSRNIGEGGIFIETDLVQDEDIALNKDTILDLDIGLLGQARGVRPRGRVAWISKKSRAPKKKRNGFGVIFTRIAEQEKKAVELFISKEKLAQSGVVEKEIPFISREQKLTDRQRRNLEILDNIRKHRLISRAEISKRTNINIVTVSNYIDSYLKKGLVFERGLDISTGGRRPELVEINPQYGYALGINLSGLKKDKTLIKALACDFTARILDKSEREAQGSNIEDSLDILKGLIAGILRSEQVAGEKIKGIGIGISGIMDKFSGTVRDIFSGTTVANYLTIKKALEDEFGLSVCIENASACALFAEKWVGISLEAKEAENILYIFSDDQCAIMIKGELYTGVSNSAGQLNFVFPRSAAAQNTVSSGRELGAKIAYLVNIFNPQLVIIGGGLSHADDSFLEAVRRTVGRCSFRESASIVRIIPAGLAQDAAALGAASLVIEAALANI